MQNTIALIVEPDHLWRGLLFRHLDHAKASFLFANNAADARKSIIRHEPNLVVTELNLPDFSGLELIRQMRQTFAPAVRILVLSRDFDRDSLEQGLNFGVSAYMEKGAMSVKDIALSIASALDGR